MQWSCWLLLVGMVLLWTTSTASPSNASPRELKALKAALKKQQRIKEQQQQQQQQRGTKGSNEYVPDAGPWSSTDVNEPSCEQLREMWRQSKRHSRAAEATNEIPQYADPFARANSIYARQLLAEPTLRPRPERRPVVYGRLHSSPPVDSETSDRPLRPFDVLRKLSRTESDGQSSADPQSGVVLYSEDDRSPFAKSTAKGSLQHLRELVREEQPNGQAVSIKGSFQQLRDIVREENRQRTTTGRSDWKEADVGRLVTSPTEHSAPGHHSKYSLYAMQGDAPYQEPSLHQHNLRRPPSANNNNNNNRLSSFGSQKSQHHRNHNSNRQQQQQQQQTSVNSEQMEAAGRKAFQLRDPPRPRMTASGRLAGSRANSNGNRWSSSDPEDVGVIRGYVAGRPNNNNPLYSSKPSRRSSASSSSTDSCRCSVQQRCQRGRCVPARNQSTRKQEWPINRDEDDVIEDEESQLERNEESDDDRMKERRSDDIQDIIDALRQIDQESSD